MGLHDAGNRALLPRAVHLVNILTQVPVGAVVGAAAAGAAVGGAAGAVVAGAPGAAQAATRSRPTNGASSCFNMESMQALFSRVRGAPMYHLQRMHDEQGSAASHTDVRCT